MRRIRRGRMRRSGRSLSCRMRGIKVWHRGEWQDSQVSVLPLPSCLTRPNNPSGELNVFYSTVLMDLRSIKMVPK